MDGWRRERIASAGQQAKPPRIGEADDDLDALKADLAALRSEVAGVVQAIRGLGETAVATAKRQKGAAIERLTAEAQSLTDEATSAARDQVAELESRIRAQPLAAVGIAFVVGLLFGSLRR